MANDVKSKIMFTKYNEHLSDIFTDNCYVELGNIPYDALNDLLKKKLVSYKNIAYKDIVTFGKNSFSTSNQDLNEKLSFAYLYNLVTKNKSLQIVITYGLLVKRTGYKETFTPMILIPVNMYFEDNDILFQLIAKPIENPNLRDEKKVGFDFLTSEKLDTVYSLDRFAMSFIKHQTINVRLESFVTFISLKQPEIQINHEKFFLDPTQKIGIDQGYSIDSYTITPLNQQQRHAVLQAHCGMNFAISGYDGTGKTTALLNIASDAINSGKRVLYVSNNNNTLNYVTEVFKEKGLDNYVASFINSFHTLNEKTHEIKRGQIIDKVLKLDLLEKYKEIEKYETILSNRIANFPFLEIIKELILTKTVESEEKFSDKVMENCQTLYRHEVYDVLNCLQIIDNEIPHLTSFKDSKFNNIPINNQIKSSEQTLSLLKGIYDSYLILFNEKTFLESHYGFNEIYNYARFINVIANFKNTKISDVPSSWIEYNNNEKNTNLKNFLDAKNLYEVFKNELYVCQEIENSLYQKYDYEKLAHFNVNEAINAILGEYFKIDDEEKINKVLKEYNDLINIANKAISQISILESNFAKMRTRLNINIALSDTKVISQITSFMEILNKGKICKTWLNTSKYEGIHNKLINIEQVLNKYYDCLDVYHKYFEKIDDVAFHINNLENRKNKNDKYKDIKVNDLLDNLYFIKEHQLKISGLLVDYKGITDQDYMRNISLIHDHEEFNKRFLEISSTEVRNRMAKSLQSMHVSGLQDLVEIVSNFKRSYDNITLSYITFASFGISNIEDNVLVKIENLEKIKKYLIGIKNVQEKMRDLLKVKPSVILYDNYLNLKDNSISLLSWIEKINNNPKYIKLYGKLFTGYRCDVLYIGRLIKSFELFVDLFKTPQDLVNSINEVTNDDIIKHLSTCEDAIHSINEYFKSYSKIFKDSVGKYYYDDFNTVLLTFSSMVNSKQELKTYLLIANQLKVLMKYKLLNLSNYIIDHDKEKFYNRFKYGYFKRLYDQYIRGHKEILDVKKYSNKLEEIMYFEKDLLDSNVEVLKLKRNSRFRFNSFKNLDYNQYINRTKGLKYIFLTDTRIANFFLDMDLFDLVLIDDAQLLHANEYRKVINCNQVIIAGDAQIQASVASNLISRIRQNCIMNFKYRYIRTPLHLLGLMQNTKGRFYNEVEKNKGYEIVNDNLANIVLNIYNENSDATINLFTSSLNKMHDFYNNIATKLCKLGLKSDEIINFLLKKVNLCDLAVGYLIDADYNVLDLNSYKTVDNEYQSINMVDMLLACSKRIVLVGEERLFNGNINTPFMKYMQKIYQSTIGEFYLDKNSVMANVGKSLSRYRIKPIGSYENFSLIVEYENKYYGLMLFEDPMYTEYALLNEYREFKANDFPTIIIWITELLNDYNKTINRLVKEIRG